MADTMDLLEKYLLEQEKDQYNNDSRLLREIAYERLLDALRNLDLQPGDPLSETRLSKALGISRTPVREAIQQLAGEGMLRIIPGRAVTVAISSMQDVLDAIHIRELLEPELVRLAAESLPVQEQALLRQLTAEMEQAALKLDRPAWAKADSKWHEILCNACPNQLLGQMVLQAKNRMYRKGVDQHVPDRYLVGGTMEHKEILEAILAGDAEGARSLMLDHIRQVRENMFKRLIR